MDCVSCVDGRAPSHFVHAVAAEVCARQHTGITEQPEGERYGLEAAGNEPAENRILSRHFIKMKRLRVMHEGKVDYAALGQCNPCGFKGVSDRQIIKIFATRHGKSLGEWAAFRQQAGFRPHSVALFATSTFLQPSA